MKLFLSSRPAAIGGTRSYLVVSCWRHLVQDKRISAWHARGARARPKRRRPKINKLTLKA